MDWTAQIDIYCERVGFGFWAEPVNALTNLLYIAGAILMYRRTAGDGLPLARALAVTLGLIGIGSFLFHTLATGWAAAADSAPIGAFILIYLFAVNRDVIGLAGWAAGAATALYLPFVALVVPLLERNAFLAISNVYWTVPILLVLYAPVVTRIRAATALGFLLGATLLSLSITVRSVDLPWCAAWPLGTHFGWHCLNSVMLPLMIEVYRRHMLATGQARR